MGCVSALLVTLGVVLSVAVGRVTAYVLSQQLVGTECLGVSQCSQVLRFQEADVAGLGHSHWLKKTNKHR